MSATPDVTITPARTGPDFDVARVLFSQYAREMALNLPSQTFEQELVKLPGDYKPPRGELLLAYVNGLPAGCCALRPFFGDEHVDAAEMKRLYVNPVFRRFGIGQQLARRMLDIARAAGYRTVLLDTISKMQAARALYAELGFHETAPYAPEPIADACYLKADLD